MAAMRMRVADYQRFRQIYDAGTSAREAGGLHNEQMFRNPKDPNDILIMSTWTTWSRHERMANQTKCVHGSKQAVCWS